jgi:hypothetical protein
MAKKLSQLKKKPGDQILQIHVSLEGTNPEVWRRILVPGSFTLEALHSVFQLTMGWQMSHLYDFRVDGVRFSDPDDFDDRPIRSVETDLISAFTGVNSILYTYDFGDDWKHNIRVEEIQAIRGKFKYPICIGGENACPPEDCGSFFGYEEFKEKISDPEHPEHGSTLRWVGGYFDPFSFDPNRINRDLLWNVDWKQGPNDQGLYHPFQLGDE